MDSPAIQSSRPIITNNNTTTTTTTINSSPSESSTFHSTRPRSTASLSNVDARGAISKSHLLNTPHRSRAISLSQADRLYQIAAEQQCRPRSIDHHLSSSTTGGIHWITPQHSPQLHDYQDEPNLEPFPQWTAPTPPRSDSGLPSVSIDDEDISVTPNFAFEQPTAEMSSLGFLLPSTYGSTPYESDSQSYTMDQNYIPPMRMSQPTPTGAGNAYSHHTSSSSPASYPNRVLDASAAHRRHPDMPVTTSASQQQTYDQYRRSYDSVYSLGPSQTIPSISGLTHSPLPSPHMGSSSSSSSHAAPMMPQYHTNMSRWVTLDSDGGSSSSSSSSSSDTDADALLRSPNLYDSNPYGQAYTTAPAPTQLYGTSHPTYPTPFAASNHPHPHSSSSGGGGGLPESLEKPLGGGDVRVLHNRPKPQCWEHGCNGRQFSTFSNLLRHQREKSGTASKSYCPKCGAEFTRTTARNGHLAHDKCTKQRRSEEGRE